MGGSCSFLYGSWLTGTGLRSLKLKLELESCGTYQCLSLKFEENQSHSFDQLMVQSGFGKPEQDHEINNLNLQYPTKQLQSKLLVLTS